MTRPSNLFGIQPIIQLVSLGGSGGSIGGNDPGLGTVPPSGQIPTATGSNTWAWGSNVATVTVNESTKVLGPFINFADGSNTTVTVDQVSSVASNTIRIHSTGGAAGSNVIPLSTINAKGDLIVGTANDAVDRLGAPFFDGSTLIRDTAQTTGLAWQANHATGADPTVNDDSSGGWRVGSRWINTTSDVEFVLVDATPGAAVWLATTGSASTITVKDEGSTQSSTVTTLDFVGAGVIASGGGATATVTISGGGGAPTTATYVTLSADASLSNERVRADLYKYHPDNIPTTAVSVGHEYNDGGHNGFTWAASDPSISDATTYPGYLWASETSTVRWYNKAWSPGSTDITYEVAVHFSTLISAGHVGIYVGDATGNDPQDIVLAQVNFSQGASTTVDFFNRNTGTFAQIGSTVTVAGDQVTSGSQFYLRVTRVNAGPTWTMYYSRNGIIWNAIPTTGSKSLTVAAIGLRCVSDSSTSEFLVPHIRGWASVVSKIGS